MRFSRPAQSCRYLGTPGALVVLCGVLAACGGSTSVSQPSSASPIRCQASLQGVPQSVSATGARVSATVITARECAWTLASDATWVQVRPATGEGEMTVDVIVAENSAGVSRTAAVTLAGSRVVISQDAAPCRYQVNGVSEDVSDRGASVELRVTANDGCGWTASSDVAWLAGVRTAGTGSGVAAFVAEPNAGPRRRGVITVAGQSLSVTQRAGSSPVPTPPLPPHPSPAPPTPTPTPNPVPTPTPTPTPPPPPAPPPATIEFNGRVSSLGGTCPSLTFLVDRRQVTTTSETRFSSGECRHLRDGMEVDVTGDVLSNGTIQARRVELKRN